MNAWVKNNLFLLILLFFAFALRIIIMTWSFNFRENTDVLRYRDWARISFLYNPAETYKPQKLSFGTIPNNMPPGSLYVINLMYYADLNTSKLIMKFTRSEKSQEFLNGALIDSFLRLPSIIADILMGFLIYIIVKKEKEKKVALMSSAIFLFNPVIWYNSAFWGQMDAVNNLFFLTSLFLFFRKKYFLSVLSFFLSLYIKLSLLPVLPLLFIVFLFKISKIKFALYTLVSLILVTLITFPVSQSPHTWIIQFLQKNLLPEMKNITSFSFNFWWVIFKPWIEIGKPTDLFNFSEIRLIGSPLDSTSFLNVPLKFWGYFIFIAFISPLVYGVFKLKSKIISTSNLFLLFSFFTLAIYFFLPDMHERYFYPFFPLFAVYVGLAGTKLWIYAALSLLNFINLYIVWHPFMTTFAPYLLINNSAFQWTISFFTVFIGVSFYLQSLRVLYERKQ